MGGLTLLEKIGRDLDRNIYPVVYDSGIVEPGQSCCLEEEPGEKGSFYESERTRRSPAGSRKWTAGGARSSGGSPAIESGPASKATSFFSEQKLSDATAVDLEGVIGAYPGVEFRFTPALVWLINSVKPIRGLNEAALIITAYPHDVSLMVKSWAWWGPSLVWIGPRHTNYPDGSICSFEPRDAGAWQRGQPLRDLVDIHTLWIVRHLFLRHFGHWPGSQVFHTAYERLKEHRPGEICGGCRSGLPYDGCCRSRDERYDPVERVISFMSQFGTRDRNPPQAISEYVYGIRKDPPSLNDIRSDPTV